jgi:1-deoxy-D-xylulose-5-phosphate synthase
VTELTVGFHYVFDSPKDKIVYDVSHQSYPHKILTGRKVAFLDPEHYGDVSGFTAPDESEHDIIRVGHTSTSVSIATGLAVARDLTKTEGNVVVLIGDGSLSGGVSFEGLNNAALLKTNFIVIVNDNEMSIDDNVGSLYGNLAELRNTQGKAVNNYFKVLGFDYTYLEEGNDIEKVIAKLQEVKDIDHPIVVHVHTLKGDGYQPAIDHKRDFHWAAPFDLATGEPKNASGYSYKDVLTEFLDDQIENGTAPIAAINAAIPGSFGLDTWKEKHPENYFDVGIAEQDSISFATGLSLNGVKPYVFHGSSFLPRAADQLSHDLAMNDAPAVIILRSGTISGGGPTHQGTFDIPLLGNIPNLTYLAPTSKEELLAMLNWSAGVKDYPVAIRVPEHGVESRETDFVNFDIPQYDVVRKGKNVAILALGGFFSLGEKVADLLADKGIFVTLINPLFINDLDTDTLDSLIQNHQFVVTLEDGQIEGGFGEKIAGFYGDTNVKVLNYGATREFVGQVSTAELYNRYRLIPEILVADIEDALS